MQYKSGIEYYVVILDITILPHELGCDALGHNHSSFHLTLIQLVIYLLLK